jgi:hypothetical protein
MIKSIMLFFIFIGVSLMGKENIFNTYFNDATMRVDYYHIGDSETEIFTIDKIYKYPKWGRSKNNLLDNFDNGRYYIKIFDEISNQLIYSKGFDSYFGEYQTSGPAMEGIKKTFHESAIIPFPKSKFKFVIEKRNREKILNEIYSTVLDPSDVNIISTSNKDSDVTVYESHISGPSDKRVDVVILGEGYSTNDKNKFRKDIDRFTKYMFEQEPYKTHKQKFNVYGILKPSAESGVDEPRANIFKETSLSTSFNSMGSERYLLTEDNKTMRDLAGYVPYDAIYIMVNSNRYGGGGIYNLYCTFTADAQFSKYLFIHEFGHSFVGLADEYYTSSTAYNEFYPRGVEPVEPNITALLDKENLKWGHLVTRNTELPTPWEKVDFDSNDREWQKERAELNAKVAELKRNNAQADEIKKAEEYYAMRDKEHSDWVDNYLRSSKYWGKVGAYEGAGYTSEGLYRPMLDCIMFSKGDKPFCKVCEEAVVNVIKHYSE